MGRLKPQREDVHIREAIVRSTQRQQCAATVWAQSAGKGHILQLGHNHTHNIPEEHSSSGPTVVAWWRALSVQRA